MIHKEIKQHVDLGYFMLQHTKIVNRTAYGSYLVAMGVCLMFNYMLGLPIIICMGIASVIAGGVYVIGYQYSSDKVGEWVRDLSVIRTEDEESEDKMPPHLLKEPQKSAMISTGPESTIFEVEISWDQLANVIEATYFHDKLIRSSLDQNVWPNLSRDWANKTIQTKIRRLGLIDNKNYWTFGGAGHLFDESPEVHEEIRDEDPSGVGGADDEQ